MSSVEVLERSYKKFCLQGGKIRSKLMNILKSESNVILEEGSAGDIGREAAQHGMRRSYHTHLFKISLCCVKEIL